jgi:exosortase A
MSALTAESQPDSRHNAWKNVSRALAVALIVLFAGFWNTYSSIVAIWWSANTFNHGFLIAPIAGYLAWTKRAELVAFTPRPAYGVAAIIAALAVLWLLGDAAEVQVIRQLAAVAMIPAVVWAILGTPVTKVLCFPLAYLIFAVPMGEALVPYLQDITASFAVSALRLTGIPVFWEGRIIAIPSGTFEVAEACSGTRYLIASLAVGTLFAYLMYSTWRRRLAFMALCLVVPIAANAVRAYGIIMLAHLSDYRLAIGIDHLIYGWIFFGVIMMLLFWAGSAFRDRKAATAPSADRHSSGYGLKALFAWTAAVAVLPLSAPLLAAWYDRPAALRDFVPVLPAGGNGWAGPQEMAGRMRPLFRGASAERCGQYRRGDESVDICIVYYATERRDAKLVSWGNQVYDHSIWRLVRDGGFEVRRPGRPAFPVRELVVRTDIDKRLLWYWYDVDGRSTASDVMAKIYTLRARLPGGNPGSGAVILSTVFDIEPAAARRTLQAFSDAMLDSVRASMRPPP